MKVRFVVRLDAGRVEPDHLASLVTGAEERGFDTLWFADLPLLNAAEPTLAVAFAAALSHRLRLGVDLVPFGHESFVVARQLAQLDQLTGGAPPGHHRVRPRPTRGKGPPSASPGRDRGRSLPDSLLPELRTWWAGSAVKVGKGEAPAQVTLPVLPHRTRSRYGLAATAHKPSAGPAGSPTGGLDRAPRSGPRGRRTVPSY